MTKKCGFKFSGFLVLVYLLDLGSGAPSGFGLANPLYAQPKYPYKKYENRKEGIIANRRQLVAGERLVLISAAIENLELSENVEKSEAYNLGFYLKEPARVKIVVREFDKNYKMEPLKKDYSSGPASFPWPSTIPQHYNIALQDLHPFGEIRDSQEKFIIPIVLFYNEPRNLGVNYRFGFIPYKTVSILKYNIYRFANKELIYSGELTNIPSETTTFLQWNGQDLQNNDAASGLFVLNVQATFRPAPGSVNFRTVTLNFNFYHFPDLFENLAE